jgi:membrane protein DedA with SNARE-associated domain
MFSKTFAIAKNTFIETVRQPVFVVIIGFAILLYILSPSIAMYTMDEDVKLLRELGLSTLFLAGLFIAVFSATGALTEEIETGTITTVLSKPINRANFLIGKFLGIAAAVFIAHFILSVAHMLSVRHGVLEAAWQDHDWAVITASAAALLVALLITAFLNYTYDWNFCATVVINTLICTALAFTILLFIDREWKFNPGNTGIALFDFYASILLLLAVIVLVALAVMFSTRFNVVLTLAFCVAAFMLGLISDYVFGRFADQHLWAKIGKIIAPNFQVFWVSDAIYQQSSIQPSYIAITSVYATLYIAGILTLAIAFFRNRQIG